MVLDVQVVQVAPAGGEVQVGLEVRAVREDRVVRESMIISMGDGAAATRLAGGVDAPAPPAGSGAMGYGVVWAGGGGASGRAGRRPALPPLAQGEEKNRGPGLLSPGIIFPPYIKSQKHRGVCCSTSFLNAVLFNCV